MWAVQCCAGREEKSKKDGRASESGLGALSVLPKPPPSDQRRKEKEEKKEYMARLARQIRRQEHRKPITLLIS